MISCVVLFEMDGMLKILTGQLVFETLIGEHAEYTDISRNNWKIRRPIDHFGRVGVL
jgi:hypothetical protein